jgi:nucleotide-binding universal stress UspA family protein
MPQQQLKILFPTDFSEFSEEMWDFAVGVASKYDAKLIVIHVIEPPTGVLKFLSDFNEELAMKQGHKMVDNFIEKHEAGEVHVAKMVKIGKVNKMIGQAVLEVDASFIIMGTHGASGFQEFLVGSNAAAVVRSSPCPVLTLKVIPKEPNFKKILLPVDFSQETQEKVSEGVRMAKRFKAEILVVSVLTSDDPEEAASVARKMQAAEAFCKSKNVAVSTEVIQTKEGIAQPLLNYANEKGVDLICIMTQQELKVMELFLGSQATQLVNHSKIPILSIRPKNMFSVRGKRSYFG